MFFSPKVSGLVNLAIIKNAAGRVQIFYEGAGILLFESLAAVASDAKFVARLALENGGWALEKSSSFLRGPALNFRGRIVQHFISTS